jgi:hypothetical protein
VLSLMVNKGSSGRKGRHGGSIYNIIPGMRSSSWAGSPDG